MGNLTLIESEIGTRSGGMNARAVIPRPPWGCQIWRAVLGELHGPHFLYSLRLIKGPEGA